MQEKHPSHFIWEESLEVVKKLRPPRVYFVGMNHSVNHEEVNKLLSEFSEREGITVELAHDGLQVTWNFHKESQ